MIIYGHAYYNFVFPNPGDICLKGKLFFKSLPDIQLTISSYIMFEAM